MRYVVTVGEASTIDAAIGRLGEMRAAALDAEPRRWRRMLRRAWRRLNPFNLIRLAAEALGELAAVNVLGAPGAGLESVARRERISSRTSLRHAALFVGSWFDGARLLGAVLEALYAIPAVGGSIEATTHLFGRCFDTVTDVRRPVGAVVVAVVVAAVIS